MAAALRSLLECSALVWRGVAPAAAAKPGVPTGFPELDRLLPGGGWPGGALTELISETEGIGEVSLFGPALSRVSREDERWIAFIAPPHFLYAPALANLGIDLARIVLVRSPQQQDAPWAAEQTLRSGAASAVLAWLPAPNERMLKKLSLAAEAGRSMGVYFPAAQAARHATPAVLRLRLSARGGKSLLTITKRRGGGECAPLALDLGAA
ncbi:MAG: translesion DNA synthesis-associated protein ImuA [Betaproteobacteria bacterium]|nr:translesion DNA synthesis-associated protein ImuA [Betaproteobacteria bacterium]